MNDFSDTTNLLDNTLFKTSNEVKRFIPEDEKIKHLALQSFFTSQLMPLSIFDDILLRSNQR